MKTKPNNSIRFGRWEIMKDFCSWEVRRHYEGKKGPAYCQTWHRDLRQVANWITNEDAKDAVDDGRPIHDVFKVVQEAEKALAERLKA